MKYFFYEQMLKIKYIIFRYCWTLIGICKDVLYLFLILTMPSIYINYQMQSQQKGEQDIFGSGLSSFFKKRKSNDSNVDQHGENQMQPINIFWQSKFQAGFLQRQFSSLNDQFPSLMKSQIFKRSIMRDSNQVANQIIVNSKLDSTRKEEEQQVVLKIEDESPQVHVLGENKNAGFESEQANQSGSQSTKKKQKKKQLSESNAIKNFSNNFVKQLSNPARFNDLKIKYKIDENPRQKKKQFKNILDNIKKKIKYQKRSQKLQQVSSMISHKNKRFTNFLIDACQRYLGQYQQVISQSRKIKNKTENKKVIQKIREVIEEQRRNLKNSQNMENGENV